MIEIIGTALNQWDTGRSVKVTDIEADRVHFANKGDSKAVIMDLTDSQAKIPEYLLQTGKQVCVYAVKNGVTVESKIFYVKTRERPENYVYDSDQRNYIYELITNAETAVKDANEAVSSANLAAQKANDSAVNTNLATANANKAADSASLAASNANASATGANLAAKNANEAADSANLAANNANASADIAGSAAVNASKATDSANLAAQNANNSAASADVATANAYNAADGANLAASNANASATGANRAAENTNLAAQNANKAADKAAHTAKSLMVVGSAKGKSIYLDDAIDQFLVGLRVFGKTTQAGTPTPATPVELVSVVNPTVTVNGQALLVPHTLHGIHVTSGGNYTDENGQQWVCDEIDLERGVYVQRVMQKTYDGSIDELWWTGTNHAGYAITVDDMTVGWRQIGYCDRLQVNSTNDNSTDAGIWFGVNNNGLYVHDVNTLAQNVDAWRLWLSENPMTIQYIVATPIETPLAEEELAAFAALRTYRGNTTISNDASAHMEIEYVMDARKYIDRMMAPVKRISSVSLPASQWTGSDNLYSQVAYIEGITENSQVNLIPSVEQLASFYYKDITFITENDGGVVTVYVVGQKPQNDYTIQVEILEVIA